MPRHKPRITASKSRDRTAVAALPRSADPKLWEQRLNAGVFRRRGERRYADSWDEARHERARAYRLRYYLKHGNTEASRINCRRWESAAGLWGNQYWTPAEYEFARHWFREGRSYLDIAYALQRSARSVRDKIQDPDGNKRGARDRNKPEYQGDFAARQRLKTERGEHCEANPNSRTRLQNRRQNPRGL